MDIVKCLKKSKNKFGMFIEEYLFSRKNISLIILILDIRHKPTEDDRIMYDYIKSTNNPYVIIANKADKIAITKVENAILEIRNELNLNDEEILLPFSSARKIYIDDIYTKLESVLSERKGI